MIFYEFVIFYIETLFSHKFFINIKSTNSFGLYFLYL